MVSFIICREKRWQRGFHGTTGSISGSTHRWSHLRLQIPRQAVRQSVAYWKWKALCIFSRLYVIENAENWCVPSLHLQLSYSAASLFVNFVSTAGWWDSKGARWGHPGSVGCTNVYKNWCLALVMVFFGTLFTTGSCGNMIITLWFKELYSQFLAICTISNGFSVEQHSGWPLPPAFNLGWWPQMTPFSPHQISPVLIVYPRCILKYGSYDMTFLLVQSSNPIIISWCFHPLSAFHDTRIISPSCRLLKTQCYAQKFQGLSVRWGFWWFDDSEPSVFDGHIPTSVSLALQ